MWIWAQPYFGRKSYKVALRSREVALNENDFLSKENIFLNLDSKPWIFF